MPCKSWVRDQRVVFRDCLFSLQFERVDRRSRSEVFQSLVVDKVARLRYMRHCNCELNSFLWRSNQQRDSQKNPRLSLHKIKMARRRSKAFCDQGRTWLINTSFDNTEKTRREITYHHFLALQIFANICSVSKWTSKNLIPIITFQEKISESCAKQFRNTDVKFRNFRQIAICLKI